MATDVADDAGTGTVMDGPQGQTSTALPATSDDAQRAEDAKIMTEMKERFDRTASWESTARQRWVEDYKFANGDAENQYQWPNAIRRSRDIDQRPCLTINKVRQHNLQIINDGRQNKPSVKIRATGYGSSVDSSKIYNGIVRHIEYRSNADAAYDIARKFQCATSSHSPNASFMRCR